MIAKNRYIKRSKITEAKFRQIVSLFAVDLNAKQIAEISRLNRNTVNRYLLAIRQRIAQYCEQDSPYPPTNDNAVEVDESYFGPRRIKGRRGRGTFGKTIVFGLIKRHGKVYTEIVPNASKSTLQAIIRGKVAPRTIISSMAGKGSVA